MHFPLSDAKNGSLSYNIYCMVAPHSHSQPYVTQIDLKWSELLRCELLAQQFTFSIPPHTRFLAKKGDVSCILYTSGKLVIQGKGSSAFIASYLEPRFLAKVSSSPPTPARIGIDESGKGDFFGPLCIAGVYLPSPLPPGICQLPIQDSKKLSDGIIRRLADDIRTHCLYSVIKINPPKYNEIYRQFGNLNRLLAWGHATAIEQLVAQSSCETVIIDQFADESVVLQALERKQLKLNLTQRHRAEDDLAVAAASILARDAFLEGMEALSQAIGMPLPKGCSSHVIAAGEEIVKRWGEAQLRLVSKQHFKTLDVILRKAGQ